MLSPFHKLKHKQPIEKYLDLVFSPQTLKQKCPEKGCKSKSMSTTQEIRFLPQTLIFVYPMDDLLHYEDDGENPPDTLDLEKYLSFIVKIEKVD